MIIKLLKEQNNDITIRRTDMTNYIVPLQLKKTIRLYKLERILIQRVEFKSAINFNDFFYKIYFLLNSLSNSANTVLAN